MKTRLLHLAVAWAADGARGGEGGIPAKPVWWWDERPLTPALEASLLVNKQAEAWSQHARRTATCSSPGRHPRTHSEHQRLHAKSNVVPAFAHARPGVDSSSANSGALLLLWSREQT